MLGGEDIKEEFENDEFGKIPMHGSDSDEVIIVDSDGEHHSGEDEEEYHYSIFLFSYSRAHIINYPTLL